MTREEWTHNDWRDRALSLEHENQELTLELSRVLALLESSVGSLEDALRLTGRHKVAARLARTIENGVASGSLKVKYTQPRKRPGRPRLLTLTAALLLMDQANQFRSAAAAARHLAAEQLRREGLNPLQHTTRCDQRTATYQNKISKARKLCAEENLRLNKFGLADLDRRKNRG